MVLRDSVDLDLFAVAEDELAAAVQLFTVRGGRIRGARAWVLDKEIDISTGDIVEQALQDVYAAGAELPREIVVPTLARRRRRARDLAHRSPDGCGDRRQDARPRRSSTPRSAATSPTSCRPRPSTPARRSCSTRRSAAPISRRARPPWPTSRRRSAWPTRPCGWSATTSRTSRAPTSWRRWSCSKTGCPAKTSTAASASRRRPTTPSRSTRRSRADSRGSTTSWRRSKRWGSSGSASPTAPTC